MTQIFPTNTLIQLTSDLYNQLVQQKEAFEIESKQCEKQFDSSNDTDYYLVSTKFLKEWETMIDAVVYDPAPTASKKQVKTPSLMNQELIQNHLADFNEHQLKKQIQEGVHFKFYNYAVMSIFIKYEGARIPRRAYYSGVEKKVQMFPIKFDFIFISNSWINLLRNDEKVQFPVLTSLGYKNETISDLSYRLIDYSKKDPRNRDPQYINNAAAQIYFAQNFDPKQYAKKLRQQKQFVVQKLEAPGWLVSSSKQIGDLVIPSEKYLLIVQLQEQKWVFSNSSQRCQFCRQLKVMKFQCTCKQVKYCSQECKDKDWKYHVRTCESQLEEDKIQPQYQIKENSRRGLVGLANLGNTCYMNAALQCMIHTQDLTEYFRSKKYLSQINENNPIGSKGKLVRSYAKFIESVLCTEEDVVTPSRLKYAIGKTKEMFSGFEQHDSQQFLLFMLDTLHEDLNRVINKPYTSGVENQGRPDEVVAKESWITYLKRNQSCINDLMGGQYRSEVKCPDCLNISVTFDPYLIFAVPIPSNEAKSINLYYFSPNFKSNTLKITLNSKNNLVRELRQDLATKTKSEANQILFVVSGFNGSVRKVDDLETVDKLINEKQLNENSEEKQLFAMHYQPEELQNLDQKSFLVFKFITKAGATLTFKRPFPLPRKNLKGTHLYDRVCQFTLNLWNHQKSVGKERQTKFNVLKTKALQEKLFRINLCYGKPTQVKNKLIYENRIQIQQDTDVSELLQKYNFEVQFEAEYAENPYYSFNSYSTYSEDKAAGHYDYGEGPKIGSDQTYTLEECFNEMKKSEKLVEGNQVFCSKCEDLKLAEKKMEMYKASKYLVLQLRRFKQVGYEKSKNYAEVKFPFELDLTNHIISPQSPENYFVDDQEFYIKPKYWTEYDKSASTKYRLYGVVNHHGGLNGGHYTAFGNHKGKWYKFDDRDVTEVEEQKIVSCAAYLLFYERI